jgi:YfiH family protein
VVDAAGRTGRLPEDADALTSTTEGGSVGIVTADCVPILASSRDGRAVVAIHAGWRGLAAGVIEAGIEALRRLAGARTELVCAVGPAARGCCYEVDAPVIEGLERRYAGMLDEVLSPTSPGHHRLDLPVLATRVLESAGLARAQIGTDHRVCTICDPGRFESYRRDGSSAGRLMHFVNVGGPIPRQA